MDHPFHILTDRQVNPSELEALAIAAGVRATSFHDHWAVRRSAAAYPFIAYARDPEGRLAGYITAFSDGAFSTFVGDLIVRPDARLKDLGLDLLHLVEETYPGVPVFLRPFDNAHQVVLEHTGIILRAPTVEWDARTGNFIDLPPDDFLDGEPA